MNLDWKDVNIIVGVFAVAALAAMPAMYLAPAPEKNTTYYFVESARMEKIPGMIGAPGMMMGAGAVYVGEDGNVVLISDTTPEWLANPVIRHENCHIGQYNSKVNRNSWWKEPECYVRMWLP